MFPRGCLLSSRSFAGFLQSVPWANMPSRSCRVVLLAGSRRRKNLAAVYLLAKPLSGRGSWSSVMFFQKRFGTKLRRNSGL